MFQIGEYIVYGNNGVCVVENIAKLEMQGSAGDKLYYWLRPVYEQGGKIFCPVDNNKTVMRRVLSKREAKELIASIEKIECLWIADDKQRETAYKKAVYSDDCTNLIRIIKTIYLRKEERVKQGKKVTATDERYFRLAEERLYQELALVLGKKKEEMQAYIAEQIMSRKNGEAAFSD